jgi:hypothetical protein
VPDSFSGSFKPPVFSFLKTFLLTSLVTGYKRRAVHGVCLLSLAPG